MNKKLALILDRYIRKVPEVKIYCQRCLDTARWDGNVVVMVVDASYTSIGLNYFSSVVPNVERFINTFIITGKVNGFKELVKTDNAELENVWKNKRSWKICKAIATYLASIADNRQISDRDAFIQWAKESPLDNWAIDPIGKVKGVGINTYQYLRMMGGIDTVMPDKIVKRIINNILCQADEEIPESDISFVRTVERIGLQYGYRPIELCWMTWLIQSESNHVLMHKNSEILSKI